MWAGLFIKLLTVIKFTTKQLLNNRTLCVWSHLKGKIIINVFHKFDTGDRI